MRIMNSGLQNYLLKKQIEKSIDSDLVDIEAQLDDTLTLTENINEFKRKGLIQRNIDEYDCNQEYIEEQNHLYQYYTCKKCGNTNMAIRKYDSHTGKLNWVVVECECGFWNCFYDNTDFRN